MFGRLGVLYCCSTVSRRFRTKGLISARKQSWDFWVLNKGIVYWLENSSKRKGNITSNFPVQLFGKVIYEFQFNLIEIQMKKMKFQSLSICFTKELIIYLYIYIQIYLFLSIPIPISMLSTYLCTPMGLFKLPCDVLWMMSTTEIKKMCTIKCW